MGKKRIGLALSGGGIRALIFHLGTLKWLAEQRMMEDIAQISSVSGGSLCAGLIFVHSGKKWPSSSEFLNHTLPKIEEIVLNNDIQVAAMLRLFPFWLHRRTRLLAKVMSDKWQIGEIAMKKLAHEPLWDANCTTYETGKRFRINQQEMGDFVVGVAHGHDMLVADAMAASAGFPFLIGPYALRWKDFDWTAAVLPPNMPKMAEFKPPRRYHLWDGGVYDNLGLEALFHISSDPTGGRLVDDIDHIVVSNAGQQSGFKRRGLSSSPKRLLDIAMEQVGVLRTRTINSHIRQMHNGMHCRIGRSAAEILELAPIDFAKKRRIIAESLPQHQARFVRDYKTTLRTPTEADFRLIMRHGYETARCNAAFL